MIVYARPISLYYKSNLHDKKTVNSIVENVMVVV